MEEKVEAIERTKMVIQWIMDQNIASSNRRVAELMKYNPSTLSLILNGKIMVKERFAHTLCSLSPKLNPNWILTGEGSMLYEGQTTNIDTTQTFVKEKAEKSTKPNTGESAIEFAARMEYSTLLNLISRLEKNMNEMKEEYEARITNLEEQIAELTK